MITLISLSLFGAFVGTGILLVFFSRGEKSESRRQAMTSAFIAVALAGSLTAGLAQKEFWPFSAFALISEIHPPDVTHSRLVAVDAGGVEHEIDYRAWQPLVFDELASWIDRQMPRLDSAGQDQAAAYLLELAEAGRRRARDGRDPGSLENPLGPFTAPYFMLHPKIWSSPAVTPESSFTGLKIYRESWNIEARHSGEAGFSRTLIYEYGSLQGGP
jgi:hypothetical protein